MRIVINQPNYIPWRGYFDLIDDADLFLFHDDVQYTKQDWRNRNRIKTKQGSIWLTVPVMKRAPDSMILDAFVDHTQDWVVSHKRQIIEAYRAAPYFKEYADGFFELLEKRHEKLVDLDIETTLFLMNALGIQTPVRRVSDLHLHGHKTDKLIAIIKACGGDAYLSGPAAKAYIDTTRFAAEGVELLWKAYDYEPYPQLWGAFDPAVSALDLLFNCGPEVRMFLKSQDAASGKSLLGL